MIATKVELPSGIDRIKFSDKELTDVLTVGAHAHEVVSPRSCPSFSLHQLRTSVDESRGNVPLP